MKLHILGEGPQLKGTGFSPSINKLNWMALATEGKHAIGQGDRPANELKGQVF
jgi:hypothetical protein